MAISLKSIRYQNVGGSDKPYVADVYDLNTRREWGLNIDVDEAWINTKRQLELIDSISIAILSDEAVYVDYKFPYPISTVAGDFAADVVVVPVAEATESVDVQTTHLPIPTSSIAESFSFVQY